MIRWGHKVTSVAASADGRQEVTFSNGRRFSATRWSELMAAWSKVRPLVSEAKPLYTGTCFIETFLSLTATRATKQARMRFGSGTCMAVAPGKGILAHRTPIGR